MSKIHLFSRNNPVSKFVPVFMLLIMLFVLVPARAMSGTALITLSDNPLPVLDSILPTEVIAGSSSFTLTLYGSGFLTDSVVYWNEINLSTSFIDSETLTANVPPYFFLNTGSADIAVTNPAPGGGVSDIKQFTIQPKPNAWMSNAPEGGMVKKVSVDPKNSSVLYAATYNAGLFKSMTGGQNWFPINNGIDLQGNSSFYTVEISPYDSNFLVAHGLSGIFVSKNSGGFWTMVRDGDYVGSGNIEFDPVNSKTFYAARNMLYKTTDSGKTWKSITPSPFGGTSSNIVQKVILDKQNLGTIYLISKSWSPSPQASEAWKTTNSGITWTKLTGGLPEMVEAIQVDPVSSSTLYSAGCDMPNWSPCAVYRSTNGGLNWLSLFAINRSSMPDNMNIVFNQTNPNYKFIQAGDGFHFSSDSGDTWSFVSNSIFSDVFNIISDPADPSRMYVTGNFGVSKSIDTGTTLKQINFGLYA